MIERFIGEVEDFVIEETENSMVAPVVQTQQEEITE